MTSMTPDNSSIASKAVILSVDDLYTSFFTSDGEVKAVNGVNLTLKEDSILGIVGESGSGSL